MARNYLLARQIPHFPAEAVDCALIVNVCVFIFVFRLISYYHKRFKNARLLSTNFIVFFTTLAISPLLSHLNTYVVFYTTYLYKRPINFPPKFCHKYPVITKGHFNFLLKNAAFRPLYNFMCLLFFLFELFVL